MFRQNKPKFNADKVYILIIGIVFQFILTACQETIANPPRDVTVSDITINIPGPTLEPYIFKTPVPGTASIHGILLVLNPMSMIPAMEDAIYLVPIDDAGISTIPQFEPGTVPQAEVDERNGEFMITNVQPGQYAVVVITEGGSQIPARFYNVGDYAIFTIDDSQIDMVFELGSLSLP